MIELTAGARRPFGICHAYDVVASPDRLSLRETVASRF